MEWTDWLLIFCCLYGIKLIAHQLWLRNYATCRICGKVVAKDAQRCPICQTNHPGQPRP